jgi:flagellar hook-basal body complex protein FliE
VRVGGIDETATRLSTADPIERAESAPSGAVAGMSFGDILGTAIGQANQADQVAATKMDALANGMSDDLHGTMIAVKEADISIKLVGTIRNKLLDAFQEIWKTSV